METFLSFVVLIPIFFLLMSLEYRRGVRDGGRGLEKKLLIAYGNGRDDAERERKERTAKAITDAWAMTDRLGISDESMQDTMLLMDAAQEGIHQSFMDGMRKKGEGIEAPVRTHYAGRPLVNCTACGYSHPAKEKRND